MIESLDPQVEKNLKQGKIETLHDNKWISLKQIIYPKDSGLDSYVFAHESRCNGKMVAVLPFRYVDGELQFMLKQDITAPWHLTKAFRCSMTGGVEDNNPDKTAVMEIWEESGYKVSESDLIKLGTCFQSKGSDGVYHLYSVELTGQEKHEAVGDEHGDEVKLDQKVIWTRNIYSEDPLVATMFLRWYNYLKK